MAASEPIVLRAVRDASALDRERTEKAPALVFPLESTVVALSLDTKQHRLDRSSFALVPARTSYRLSAESSVVSLVTLLVGPEAKQAARREYQPDFVGATFDVVISAFRLFPRTRWVDEIVQRYIFERTVCEKHTSAAARFLETEITKELFFLGKEQLEERTRATVVREDSDLVQRARTWLEAHLFDTLHVAELARHCGSSESTVLRAFRRTFGVAPSVYVRNRRLEEALLLLESGRYTVSEVAMRVGYANVSAFTVAFRRRFGTAPSETRPSHVEVLPPHGKPPVRRRRTNN